MVFKIQDYNGIDDIMYLSFGKCEHSRELKKVDIVLDFDKDNNIVGIEIFDFLKKLKESQDFLDKILGGKNGRRIKRP